MRDSHNDTNLQEVVLVETCASYCMSECKRLQRLSPPVGLACIRGTICTSWKCNPAWITHISGSDHSNQCEGWATMKITAALSLRLALRQDSNQQEMVQTNNRLSLCVAEMESLSVCVCVFAHFSLFIACEVIYLKCFVALQN